MILSNARYVVTAGTNLAAGAYQERDGEKVATKLNTRSEKDETQKMVAYLVKVDFAVGWRKVDTVARRR